MGNESGPRGEPGGAFAGRVVLALTAPEVLVTGWSTPPLPEAWLAADGCPLRYVCHVTGSVRRLVPQSFLERGGKVSNWGEQVGPQVAEHAWRRPGW